MTKEESEEYSKNVKVGDRLEYISPWKTKIEVIERRDTGILCGLFMPGTRWHQSHQSFHKFSELEKFKILHKEP